MQGPKRRESGVLSEKFKVVQVQFLFVNVELEVYRCIYCCPYRNVIVACVIYANL